MFLHYRGIGVFWAKIPLNLTSEGLKCPQEVQVQHETCSTICGTPVQAILDQKNLTELAGGVKERQNMDLQIKDTEDEFVDDSGYTVSSHKTLDRSISSADIELANKINILKESGLI